MLRRVIIFLFLSPTVLVGAQHSKNKLIPETIGIYYGIGNENNLLFNDDDYLFKTQYFKASFHYSLNSNLYQFGIAVQPQIHFLKHQLQNVFFVKPTDENFEENRIIFSQLKSIRLYGVTVELSLRRKIFKKTESLAFIAIGPAIIDTPTERLAKGFTFIENLGIGIRHELFNELFLELRPTYNHISNARLQLPNSGYNVLSLEFGVSWCL